MTELLKGTNTSLATLLACLLVTGVIRYNPRLRARLSPRASLLSLALSGGAILFFLRTFQILSRGRPLAAPVSMWVMFGAARLLEGASWGVLCALLFLGKRQDSGIRNPTSGGRPSIQNRIV